jgi:hypothetical protein
MVLWAMSKNEEKGSVREYDGTQRSLSAVWIKVVQKKRTHSYGEAKPLL